MTRSSLLPLAVFALTAVVLVQRAAQANYNVDEGQHIATAGYFEVVFLDRDFGGPVWEESYWTLTQPSVPRYILGAALWLSGNPIPRLDPSHRIQEVRAPDRERFWDPRTYQDERRLAAERRVERPGSSQLLAARVPMALLGAGAVALLFLVGRALGGPLAGLVASLGLLLAPLTLALVPRAHAEAPLLFFTLLGLYLGVRAAGGNPSPDPLPGAERGDVGAVREPPLQPGAGEWGGGRGWPAWLVPGLLAGLATGLAAASKLTGLLGVAALGGFAVWALLARSWSSAGAARSWRWAALAAAVGLVVFVAVNPFLWPDPVGRTAAMLEFRRQELFGQRALNAGDAVPEDLGERATLLLWRSFVGEAPLARRTGLPLDAPLAAIGAGLLAWRALRGRREGGLVGPEAFALVWIATFLVGTAPNLGLDWQRYYLPTVALGLLLVGVGAEALLRAALRRSRALLALPSRGPSNAATPPGTAAEGAP